MRILKELYVFKEHDTVTYSIYFSFYQAAVVVYD